MNNLTLPRLCPISRQFNVQIYDIEPSDALLRACNILMEVAKIIPKFCASAPQSLTTNPQNGNLLLSLRRLVLPEFSLENLLIKLACQMHDCIFQAESDYSALSRFGALFIDFKDLLEIKDPTLKVEVNLNVLTKESIN